MHEASLHTKGLGIMLSASKLDKISSSPGSLSLKGMDKRLLLLSHVEYHDCPDDYYASKLRLPEVGELLADL